MADGRRHFQLVVSEECGRMLDELSAEEGDSKSALVERLVRERYVRDASDATLIFGRMSAIEKRMDMLDNKSELFYKLMTYALPFFIAHMPQLPTDFRQAEMALKDGQQRMVQLIMKYREQAKERDISFVQQIWGDSQETVGETYRQ